MGAQNISREPAARLEQFPNLNLQRCELTALGEWFVNISTRGRTQLVETHPKGSLPNTRALLSRRRVRR